MSGGLGGGDSRWRLRRQLKPHALEKELQVEVRLDEQAPRFTYRLRKEKLRQVRKREGRYLLRTNLTASDPAQLWRYYIQLVQVEEAFKNLKGDLAIRPVFHQNQDRIEAHIFVSFLAYCVHVTLRHRLRQHAPGLIPRAVLEKFATITMLDAWFPTTDGRWLLFARYTQPENEHKLLLTAHGKLTAPHATV